MAESPAQTAFAEEALTHLDTLYRGALRLTRDPDQAQDLVQEAYLRAIRYQHSYQQGTNMKAWLFAIMRNLFWDRFKGSRKDDVSLDDVGEFILYEKLRDEGARPEADVLDKLAASEVVKAVEKLPPLHREVVLLVDVEGFSYKDAAEALGVPIGTVMSRLHRARQQLQKSLYDYAVESGIVRGSGSGSGGRCPSREEKGSTMKCKDCEDKLDRFVDRELSPTEVLELQLHLESCPDCTEHYDFQVHLKRLVKHACECDAAPPAFRDKLRQLLT